LLAPNGGLRRTENPRVDGSMDSRHPWRSPCGHAAHVQIRSRRICPSPATTSKLLITVELRASPADHHAFLWDGATLQDLNALIDPADPLRPFVTLLSGLAINDLGQILAAGTSSRNRGVRAYLLTPVSIPESGTLALLGLGLLGLGVMMRRAY